MVLVDTLRADHMSLYGYERRTTPSLEELAESAVVFSNALSQSSCTFPSVNSILTSRYPQEFVNRPDRDMTIPAATPPLPSILQRNGYATAAVSASLIVRKTPSEHNKKGGFDRGFERFDEECARRRAPCVNRSAVDLLDELKEPFFLYLHYLEPHAPYLPPRSHERRFATGTSDDQQIRNGQPWRISRRVHKGKETISDEPSLAKVRHLIDLYDEEVLFFDGQFRSLVEEVASRGLKERTVIVLLSDHGEEMLEHGSFGHCRSLSYQNLLATPLLMWIPGVEGATRSSVVENLDVVPTLLELLKIDSSDYDLAGRSLVPVIASEEPVERYAYASQGRMRVVRDRRYKLLYDLENGAGRLYDLSSDPGETTDRAADLPDVTARLERALFDWVESLEGLGDEDGLRWARELEAELEAVGYL